MGDDGSHGGRNLNRDPVEPMVGSGIVAFLFVIVAAAALEFITIVEEF